MFLLLIKFLYKVRWLPIGNLIPFITNKCDNNAKTAIKLCNMMLKFYLKYNIYSIIIQINTYITKRKKNCFCWNKKLSHSYSSKYTTCIRLFKKNQIYKWNENTHKNCLRYQQKKIVYIELSRKKKIWGDIETYDKFVN